MGRLSIELSKMCINLKRLKLLPSEEFESELDVGEEEEEVPKPSSLRSVLR